MFHPKLHIEQFPSRHLHIHNAKSAEHPGIFIWSTHPSTRSIGINLRWKMTQSPMRMTFREEFAQIALLRYVGQRRTLRWCGRRRATVSRRKEGIWYWMVAWWDWLSLAYSNISPTWIAEAAAGVWRVCVDLDGLCGWRRNLFSSRKSLTYFCTNDDWWLARWMVEPKRRLSTAPLVDIRGFEFWLNLRRESKRFLKVLYKESIMIFKFKVYCPEPPLNIFISRSIDRSTIHDQRIHNENQSNRIAPRLKITRQLCVTKKIGVDPLMSEGFNVISTV